MITQDEHVSHDNDYSERPEDPGPEEPLPRYDAGHSHRLVAQLGATWIAYATAHAAYLDKYPGEAYRAEGEEWDAKVQGPLDRYLDAEKEMQAWAKMVAKEDT